MCEEQVSCISSLQNRCFSVTRRPDDVLVESANFVSVKSNEGETGDAMAERLFCKRFDDTGDLSLVVSQSLRPSSEGEEVDMELSNCGPLIGVDWVKPGTDTISNSVQEGVLFLSQKTLVSIPHLSLFVGTKLSSPAFVSFTSFLKLWQIVFDEKSLGSFERLSM